VKTARASVWTACEVLGVDPQAHVSEARSAAPSWGTGGNHTHAVRSLVHTGMPLPDSRPGLFPTVPSPYSYNL
jgi:hypothetical protein